MISHKVTATTELTERSDLEITEFIEKAKDSFKNVEIISIESLPMDYNKYNRYTYRIKFYHDLYLQL